MSSTVHIRSVRPAAIAGVTDAGPAADNLALRAAQPVLAATGERFGVHLSLDKRIPLRAGRGGGSSDGAAALQAVNRLAGDAVPRHELPQFAARLGSDVPFLLTGAPLALGWGRGERLLPACVVAWLSQTLDPYGELAANLLNPPRVATTSTGWVSLNMTGMG